jgi:hypothetical protein
MASKDDQARMIIDGAVANLVQVGMKRESALSLLVIQASIRINDQAEIARLIAFLDSRVGGYHGNGL